MARFVIDGYGQIEMNNATWPRDGSVEAQSKLNTTDFSNDASGDTVIAENGMILQLDGAAREYRLPVADSLLPYVVLYSTEKAYEFNASNLKSFKHEVDGFLPRAGYPEVGDKWTTNCFDLGDQADFAAIKAAISTGLYAAPDVKGAMKLSTTAPTAGFTLKVIKAYSMPDGQPGIQVQLIRK